MTSRMSGDISRRGFIAAVPALGLAVPAAASFADAPDGDLAVSRAIERLQTTASVMMVGAHPDDERSGMLAALRYGFGMRITIALATRGESGQNAIGPERGLALGALRTREMEEAARVLDASVEWLADGPADGFSDFGYSRSPADTLNRWGGDHLVRRMAEAIRLHRPDLLIAAFPNVPAQHAHHRAVVAAASDAIRLAADPAADLAGEHWQTAFHFNPVAAGDRIPGDIAVESGRIDPVTGQSFGALGEASRILHRSQNQGVANKAPPPLWLLRSAGGAVQQADIAAIAADYSLGALAKLVPATGAARQWLAAQALVDTLAAAPTGSTLDSALLLGRLLADIESSLPDASRDALLHRVRRKRREVDALLHLINKAEAAIEVQPVTASPGGTMAVRFATAAGARCRISRTHLRSGLALSRHTGAEQGISIAADALPTPSFPRRYDVLGGNDDIWIDAELRLVGYRAVRRVDPAQRFYVLPAESVRFETLGLLFNLAANPSAKTVRLAVNGVASDQVGLSAPAGWPEARREGGTLFRMSPPTSQGSGRLVPSRAGKPAHSVTRIDYPHVGACFSVTEASLPVLAVQAVLPAGARVCCVTDDGNLGYWLSELGITSDTVKTVPALAGYTTLIAASDAFTNDAPASLSDAIEAWVWDGGHFVLLAQRRTRDGATGIRLPLDLEIGAPRNAWRVTLPDAAVTNIASAHPLLAAPNRIGPMDFDGWQQERAVGLASRWNAAFDPLLLTGDEGQTPLGGALLSAPLGQGRVTFVALALERQLDALVPGGFRLLANLVQPAKKAR